MPLSEALEYLRPSHENGAMSILQRGPELVKEITKALREVGFRSFTPLGFGYNAIAFYTTCNQVVRITSGEEGKRHKSPYILQPILTLKVGNIEIEVLPLVRTEGVTDEHVRHVAAKLAEAGFFPGSVKKVNIGLLEDGTPILMDGAGTLLFEEFRKYSEETPERIEEIRQAIMTGGYDMNPNYNWDIPVGTLAGVITEERLTSLAKIMGSDDAIVTALKNGMYLPQLESITLLAQLCENPELLVEQIRSAQPTAIDMPEWLRNVLNRGAPTDLQRT